ncbi:aspartyl-phosphate phosphatase Spo0E family protein [Zhaonella formicivorans]|jgi:hypothetical protein|uniref:aspartyl-phosphate phosphatase Spo0E family protein n=1 Tax=Zhaonella formicivorans TaxID=2528593 RepID=UPI0010F3EB17|nr:aspartyl-phosphate phosphatase Spo0E family protein [Zhaonella formicivorans]
MSILEIMIEKLRRELSELVLKGISLNDSLVIKKSQELDAYITAYYQKEKKHT